ncbi:LOW QUALITY PROTEIN: hypothetical protein HMPREF0005_05979, partial [Achromobacter xylosoxidans C54]
QQRPSGRLVARGRRRAPAQRRRRKADLAPRIAGRRPGRRLGARQRPGGACARAGRGLRRARPGAGHALSPRRADAGLGRLRRRQPRRRHPGLRARRAIHSDRLAGPAPRRARHRRHSRPDL